MRRRPILALPLVAGCLVAGGLVPACGGAPDTDGLSVALRLHALPCDNSIPGLQAELGIPEHETCGLDVSATSRTVSGTCPQIASGRVYEVRLAYFVQLTPEERVEIARIYQTIDLTSPSDSTVTIQFPQAQLETDIDDDNDNMSNVAEVCAGRDPKRAGE